MEPECFFYKNSSKLSLTPNYSSVKVKREIFRTESKLLVFFAFGALTTITNSYSALGPNLSVIRFVSSFEIGFSTNQDSVFISELTMELFLFFLSCSSKGS